MGLFLQFAAPALAGIFVGVMSGLLGVGGGAGSFIRRGDAGK